MEIIKYSWIILDGRYIINSFDPINPYLYILMSGDIIDIRYRRIGCFGPICVIDPYSKISSIDQHIDYISKEVIRLDRDFKLGLLGIN